METDKVKDHKYLLRDRKSKAILNTNVVAHNTNKRIDNLESDIADIKFLLHRLLEK